ncbi:hypothetical protein BDA99DRAFT_510669 [Phascolomyces articulosus]|uniref:Uncharacterized protein n=1 Tax=Phascolomyces articulosus TaxID=60185 RepID=A0AAD5K9Q9_9FUNG|nr:hypothetical protein BDA99DRAFT_510669 [Phascolomyces articulosus]
MTQHVEKTLKDKVAVITGGSRGIGRAVAEALIARGASVVIGDILEAEGKATAEEFNTLAGSKIAVFIRTDVTSYKDNIALFQCAEKEFGGVDIAFLNAGIAGQESDIALGPPDDKIDERAMDVNGISVIKGTKIAILHMAKRGGGVIVNTASMLGVDTMPSTNAYSASKHAVVGWTRSFTLLPQVCNVRVNAVCPHYVDTDMIAVHESMIARGGPMVELIPKIHKATISNVVKGVLTLIEDQQRNAQTLLVLPDDVLQIAEPAIPDIVKIGAKPDFEEAYKKYERDYVTFSKKRLEYSLQEYEKIHGKFS